MITINFYGLMPNPRIQSEAVPIYHTLDDIITSMVERFKPLTTVEDQVFNFCFPFKLLENVLDRVRFFANIYDAFPKEIIEQLKADNSLFQLKNYLITPNGKVLFVKDFDKVFANFEFIEKQAVDSIKNDDTNGVKKLSTLRDEMILIKEKNPDIKNFMIATTVLGYIYELFDEDIENHREDLQSSMIASIKHVREEAEENAEIRNELDILNKQIKYILKDPNERAEDEFQYCTYNGEEVSQEEIVDILTSHVLPEYLIPQVDINETLEDTYRIETNKLIITRETGGALKIKRK